MDESKKVKLFMADITSLRAKATPAMKWMDNTVEEMMRRSNERWQNLVLYGNIDKGKAPGVRG